jgi:hypothetical protein
MLVGEGGAIFFKIENGPLKNLPTEVVFDAKFNTF